MAAAAAGIFNHAMTAGQAMTGKSASPMSNSTSSTGNDTGTSDSSGDSATISANDFLTLLVTEMQNQDPTANTDPNEYINQLVQVNSLEQLIDINQTLSGDVAGAATQSANGTSGQSAGAAAPPAAASATGAQQTLATASSGDAASGIGTQTSPANRAPGNLSVPQANAAAQRVGHALDGRTHARPVSTSRAASRSLAATQ